MDKIASFQINHLLLNPGIYVSRKDKAGDQILTTFDIRMTKPNYEPVMNTAEVHTIEHLGATFLRNNEEYKDRVIYFGPMGCRTGFYLILAGDYESKDIVELMISMFEFIRHYHDPIPGANPRECGNYLDMNLGMAKYLAAKYLKVLTHIDEFPESRLVYPEYRRVFCPASRGSGVQQFSRFMRGCVISTTAFPAIRWGVAIQQKEKQS